AAIEPRPESRGRIAITAHEEEPRGDQSPGHEGLPERVDDCLPGKAGGEVSLAVSELRDGHTKRHEWNGNHEAIDAGARAFPVELGDPVVSPGRDANRSEERRVG